MPALVAGIHVFFAATSKNEAWMAGTSPAMTGQMWRQNTGALAPPRCLNSYTGLVPVLLSNVLEPRMPPAELRRRKQTQHTLPAFQVSRTGPRHVPPLLTCGKFITSGPLRRSAWLTCVVQILSAVMRRQHGSGNGLKIRHKNAKRGAGRRCKTAAGRYTLRESTPNGGNRDRYRRAQSCDLTNLHVL